MNVKGRCNTALFLNQIGISLKGADVILYGVGNWYVDKASTVLEMHNPERINISSLPVNSAVHVT